MVWKSKFPLTFIHLLLKMEENNLLFQVQLFHLYLLQIIQIKESCPAKISVFKLQFDEKQRLCLEHAHILVLLYQYEEILVDPVE